MIKIDETDKLYKYLTGLKVDDIDKTYLEFASAGRYNHDDILAYLSSRFQPSTTSDFDETELEKILDYYVDLKKVKQLNKRQLNAKLKTYFETHDESTRHEIINSNLKDVLHLCLNYKSLHKDVDIQDLVQIANIGLMQAIDKYDPSAKIDFKDYMIYYIGEHIKDEFQEKRND